MSDDCKSAGILPGTSCFSSTGLLPGTSSEVSSSGILPGTSCFSSTGLLPGTSCPSSRVLMLCGNKTNDHATHSQVLMLYGNEASVHENIGLASIHENIGQAVYDDNPRYQASCEDQSQATYKHDIPREVSDENDISAILPQEEHIRPVFSPTEPRPDADSRVLILCGKDRSQATSDGTNHEKYEQDNTRHKRSDSRVLMLYGEDSTNNISAISPRENAIISAISPREDAIISAISHDPHDVSDEGSTLLGGPMEPAMKTLAVLHHMHRARLPHISSVR